MKNVICVLSYTSFLFTNQSFFSYNQSSFLKPMFSFVSIVFYIRELMCSFQQQTIRNIAFVSSCVCFLCVI